MDGFFGDLNRALDQRLTPAVKKIFIINVVVGLALIILVRMPLGLGDLGFLFVRLFGLYPNYMLHGAVWQFLTYMFVHVDFLHLLFNMVVLWFFAPELEQRWGSRRFLRFYLITGGGAGLIHFAVTMVMLMGFGRLYEVGPLIGASGALFGVMLAFAAYNPEAEVYFWGVFPIKIKYLMAILVFMEFLMTTSGSANDVSSLTHLSGIGVAYVWLSLYHREWDIRRWRWR